MAQVHVRNSSGKKWVVIAAVAVLALGAATYWFTRSDGDGTEQGTGAVNAASAPSAVGAASDALEAPYAKREPTPEDIQTVMTEQKVAAQVIEQQPDMKPIKGPITERPAFVSPMEWAMLQGVVQQHVNPEKELTRMVNFLRFMKQMETLEALPKTPANAAKRQALINQLVQDLPNRVQHGDLDLPDSQGRLTEWLQEAETNEQVRKQRADAVGKQLVEAWDVYKAAEAAKKGSGG